MSAVRDLPARPSLDSLRKQAKKLARAAAAGNGEDLARVHAQLPRASLPLSNRDAQLVIAREYGFGGWPDLTAEILIDAGMTVERSTWEYLIATGASGMLHLLARKNALPRTIPVLAAFVMERRFALGSTNRGSSTTQKDLMSES